MTFLLIEPSDENALAIAGPLILLGWEVTRAHGAVNGLALAEKTAFDAIIVGLLMEGPNRLRLCEALHARAKAVVFLVTSIGRRVHGLAFAQGALQVEPFRSRHLLALVRRHVLLKQ